MTKILNLSPNRIDVDTLDKIDRVFYICSYTGCGTMLLKNAINKQHKHVRIVHDRNPPTELEFVGISGKKIIDNNTKLLHFNGIKIPEQYIDKFTVIYIYKNPINSIYSRLSKDGFARYVAPQTEVVSFDEVITQEKDLYGLEEFFNNYTRTDINRNYKIICVNYDLLFEKQDELSELLGLEPLNLIKKETEREQKNYDILFKIYQNLIDTIKNFPFIKIV